MSETLYKLNNRNTIKLSHALNYASYSLGIVALDIVFMLIAQIKSEDEALNSYHINVIDLENRLGRQINRNSLKKILASEKPLFNDGRFSSRAYRDNFDFNPG